MGWWPPWRHDQEQEPPSVPNGGAVDSADIERSRDRMLTLLDELRTEVERIEWKEARRDRQRRPGTA